jgi:nicotinamidase-related amidase
MSEYTELDPRIAALLKPVETALLVVDMMHAYCDPTLALGQYLIQHERANFDYVDVVAERIRTFVSLTRSFPLAATVFIRTLERPEYMPQSIRQKMHLAGIPPVAEENGAGWGYYKVHPLEGDKEIIKYRYDSFMNTELDAYLQTKSVKTVIIVGGHASVCVDSTARTAAQLGYHTFVPADLTADPLPLDAKQDAQSVRNKLYAIDMVVGYMPLSASIVTVWEDLCVGKNEQL